MSVETWDGYTGRVVVGNVIDDRSRRADDPHRIKPNWRSRKVERLTGALPAPGTVLGRPNKPRNRL